MSEEMSDIFTNDSYAKKLGMKLIDWKEGYAQVKVLIQDDMLNFHGSVHGGLVYSLADYAFAVASNSHGQTAVGINTSISYVGAGLSGEELICTATEVNVSGPLAFYKMEVRNSNEELKATMEGIVYRKREMFHEKN